MSIESNKALILEYLALIQRGESDRSAAILDRDLEWWVAGSFPGAGFVPRERLVASLKSISAGLVEPLQFDIEYVTAEDDRVAVAAQATARRKDGTTYNQTYHMLFFVRDGRIRAGRPYLDTLAFAEQVHDATVTYPPVQT